MCLKLNFGSVFVCSPQMQYTSETIKDVELHVEDLNFDTFSKLFGGSHFSKPDKILSFIFRLPCMDVSLEKTLIYFYNDKSLELAKEILMDICFMEFYTEDGV